MKKCRIIERTMQNGDVHYVIQQKHFLFRWWWVDAWVNSTPDCVCYFRTLEQAKQSLCYFDGTEIKEKIVC